LRQFFKFHFLGKILDIFTDFQTDSVLGGLSLCSHCLLDPPGHGVALHLAVVLGDAHGSLELDLLDQLWYVDRVPLLQLTLHEVPHVLNGIQVGAIARPSRLVTLKMMMGNEIFHRLGMKIESCL
jgi:hypothetical protein